MGDRLAVLPQYLLPKRMLTAFAGKCAASHARWWTRSVIPWFIARYGVNMAEAADPGAGGYACFNDFFTRALRDGVRPLAQADFVSPVDGAIIQCGQIEGDQLLQAKGHRYSTRALVGGDARLAARFDDGQFATLYLSPKDYHRIHMPCDGRLVRMTYVPGQLFSVNPTTTRGVPGLFARNERVVCVFDSARGPFVLILVGATIVGSIATVWHGVVNPRRLTVVREWHYDEQAISLRQGEEMGRFLLGSTVVMLFPKDMLRLCADWVSTRAVRMGEAMAVSVVR
ncbi:archaetidylserine decarboxylase [Rhodoferax sp.]|uniref:archaetidylserine decarboxylase n=1 Tax=Rhodoferax sp. TaxID=50421 RepID=UPI00260F8766|nr:archaetidylserine decarboxylase [Rhodoferax sp.]MDD3938007.1 archaetidylserine decarboxylase [Rhodoferax sp.]